MSGTAGIVPGAPRGSPANDNDWTVGTAEDVVNQLGANIDSSFARQPEILTFLSDQFGPYPFTSAGGIVDDEDDIQFALETQTRPIYSKWFFDGAPASGDSVVVHELAHQWFGDSLTVRRWKHIWLNEGFATYAEWLWSEHEGLGTAQDSFDFYYQFLGEAELCSWDVVVADPGRHHLLDDPVYYRGAMTLHQLRLKVGDEAFFTILQTWTDQRQGGLVSTHQFLRLAESISWEESRPLVQRLVADIGETQALQPDPGQGRQHLVLRCPSAARATTATLGSAWSYLPVGG